MWTVHQHENFWKFRTWLSNNHLFLWECNYDKSFTAAMGILVQATYGHYHLSRIITIFTSNVVISSKWSASHCLIFLSLPALKKRCVLGTNWRLMMLSSWANIDRWQSPKSRPQILMLRSADPVTMRVLSCVSRNNQTGYSTRSGDSTFRWQGQFHLTKAIPAKKNIKKGIKIPATNLRRGLGKGVYMLMKENELLPREVILAKNNNNINPYL